MARISRILHTWRKVISAAIVLVGFIAALAIYLTATPPPGNPLGYQPEDTKRYLREMELYGGKANLLVSEFRQWFEGLWHGRSLAFTVALLSVLLALAWLVASTPLPPLPRAADSTETVRRDPNGSNRDER